MAGKSTFIDDRAPVRGELHVGLVYAELAAGTLNAIDTTVALTVDGRCRYLYACGLGSQHLGGPIIHDQPMMVDWVVRFSITVKSSQ